jgi:hypothetical protein
MNFSKSIVFIVAMAALSLVACKKSQGNKNIPSDFGCINRVSKSVSISPPDHDLAISLLNANHTDYSNLTIYNVFQSQIIGQYGQQNYDVSVFADQYVNGLRVLNGDLLFTFVNGAFSSSSGTRVSAISQNATPSLTLPQVRHLFIAASAQDGYARTLNLTDSCLSAEFGYYKLDPSNGSPSFVKAWYVKPQNRDYPDAVFKDSGETVFYFNGLFTLLNNQPKN